MTVYEPSNALDSSSRVRGEIEKNVKRALLRRSGSRVTLSASGARRALGNHDNSRKTT